MNELFRYEIWKRYRSNRMPIAVALIFEIVLIPLTLIFDSCRFEVASAITALLFMALTMIVPFADYLDSIVRFGRDISGTQSPLELSLPQPAWKKILSKLLAALCSFFVLCVLSMALLFLFGNLFVFKNGQNGKFNFPTFADILNAPFQSYCETAADIALFAFGMLSFMTVVCFCITLAKSIAHKNSIAAPIGIIVFIIYLIIMAIADQFASQVPIVKFMVVKQPTSITSLLFDVAFFALAFLGTSLLMGKKLES